MQNKVKVRITGKRLNEFLQRLTQEINLYDIKQEKNHLEVVILLEDYEKIKKIKTIKKLEIIDYYGMSKLKGKIKKYKVLGFSILIGILLNILLSKVVFQIEIKTPNPILKKGIQKDINSLGLKPFHFKLTKEKLDRIKKELLLKENIEWLEIDEEGTKYIITVEEKKKKKQKTCPNRDLVAKKKAVIRKIESSSGEIMKKKNDFVEKGEVIVSGAIHNKEEIVSKTCAEGKVLGETWYKVRIEIPQVVEKKNLKDHYKWKIHFGNKKENRWSIKKEYNIIKSNFYPIQLSLLYLQEVEVKKKEYHRENVDEIAYKKAEKILKNYFQEKPKIIQKKVLKKSLKNSKIIVDVFFAIEEDITSYQLISNEEIKEG